MTLLRASFPAILYAIVLSGVIAIPLQAQTRIEPDGSILLPAQGKLHTHIHEDRQRQLSHSQDWIAFIQRFGAWSVIWNEATGTPHRAYGKGIPIPGYGVINRENVQDAAMAFLKNHSGLLRIYPPELRFVRATEVNKRWYVSCIQVKDGIDVLFSEVELRLFSTGNITAFGCDWYPDIRLSTTPTIPYNTARENAKEGLAFTQDDRTSGEGRLFILPVRKGSDIAYHLVYEVFVRTSSPVGNYAAYVDAHTGQIIWRHNRVRDIEVRGRVRGAVQMTLPTDPFVEMDFFDQYVTIDGVRVTTDSLGRFIHDLQSPATLSATLQGPWVNVNRQDAPDASVSMTVNPGDSVNITWDDMYAHPAERDAFFHTNIIHNFITTLDTLFTNIDYSMPCAVNINQTCNAFWDGFGINFFREGGGCPNTAQMPSVVYHEYGHGINDRLYQQLGASNGMINGATHEGMADVASAMIEDDSRIGRGFFGPGSVLRNLSNTNRYPNNVSGDPHITGLIIGGAFWDLRVATSLQTAQYLSHFAKHGLPDDLDDGTAFSEWFVETLVADDDDGNLGNGTPHFAEIVNAFNAHGIGSSLFFIRSFSHTPLPNTLDTLNQYSAVFTLEAAPIPGAGPDSVRLQYSTDNFQTSHPVQATQTAPSQYRADIPPQSGGTLVKYYISAFDPLANTSHTYPTGAPATGYYGFLVGRHPTQAGVMYAASLAQPAGKLYTINTSTGTAAPVGSLGILQIQALAIHPSTHELYGTATTGAVTSLYRISPAFGAAFLEKTIPVGNVRAIAFGRGDTLFGGTSSGRLYRIDVSTADTSFIGEASSTISYSGFSFSPVSGELWASVRPPISLRDRIYKVSTADGSVTLVGATGDGFITPSIAFDPDGILFGLKGSSSQPNTLIRIDTTNAAGTLVGPTGTTGLLAITMRLDPGVTSAPEIQQAGIPESFVLSQNYPNPFNPATRIRYGLPRPGEVVVTIHNLVGQEVTKLRAGLQNSGFHEITWDGTDRQREHVTSGIYFYTLSVRAVEGSSFVQTRKMLLLR